MTPKEALNVLFLGYGSSMEARKVLSEFIAEHSPPEPTPLEDFRWLRNMWFQNPGDGYSKASSARLEAALSKPPVDVEAAIERTRSKYGYHASAGMDDFRFFARELGHEVQ